MNRTYKIIIIAIVLILGAYGALLFFRASSKTAPTESKNLETVKNIKIIAFGDSLTAGYNLPLQEAYPAQLETKLNELGISAQVVNSGVSGETTKGNLERANFIKSQNPDMVILGIGGNDALRSLLVTETKSNIEKTIQILTAGQNPPKIILLQMQAPLNSGQVYKQEFDKIYTSLAKAYNITLAPFITEEIFFDSSNLLPDGIHLNKKGYGQVVEKYILPAVLDNLTQPIAKG
jgi:acyl-CoA thioesterase-1